MAAKCPWLWEARCLWAENLMAVGHADPLKTVRGAVSVPESGKSAFLAWRGALQLWWGEYEPAVKDLDMAAAMDNPDALCWRGGALCRLGRLQESKRDLDRLLEIDPHDPEGLVWRGELRRLLGDRDGALKDLADVIAISGNKPWARVNRALLRLEEKDLLGAWKDFACLYLNTSEIESASASPLAAERIRELCEAALKAGRGCRRSDPHLNAGWMRAAGYAVPARPDGGAKLLPWARAMGLPPPSSRPTRARSRRSRRAPRREPPVIAAALALLLAAPSLAAPLDVSVDPRLELLGVVRLLAGAARDGDDVAPYRAAIEKRFSRLRSHPAVELYKGFAADPEREEAAAVLLLYYGPPPELPLLSPDADIHYINGPGRAEETQRFLWELRDFARVSDFASFFAANASRYREAEEAARRRLGADPVAELEAYLGLGLSARSRVLLPLLARQTRAFILPYPLPPAAMGVSAFDAYTLPAGPAEAMAPVAVWHEPLYVFLDPAFHYFDARNARARGLLRRGDRRLPPRGGGRRLRQAPRRPRARRPAREGARRRPERAARRRTRTPDARGARRAPRRVRARPPPLAGPLDLHAAPALRVPRARSRRPRGAGLRPLRAARQTRRRLLRSGARGEALPMSAPAAVVLVFALAPGAPGGDAVLAEAAARARRGPPPEAAAAYMGVSFGGTRRVVVPAGEPALERLPRSPAVTLTEESLGWLSPRAASARRTLALAVVLRALALDLGERAYERALQDPELSRVPRLAAVAERLKEYERGPRGLKEFGPRLEAASARQPRGGGRRPARRPRGRGARGAVRRPRERPRRRRALARRRPREGPARRRGRAPGARAVTKAAKPLELGLEHFNAGRYAEARAQFEAALAKDPASSRAAVWLAHAKQFSGDPEGALASALDCAKRRPKDAAAQAGLGEILGLQGRVSEAIAAYEAALALKPKDASLRDSLASLRLRAGDPAAAASSGRAASGGAHARLASGVTRFQALVRLRDWAAAFKHADSLLADQGTQECIDSFFITPDRAELLPTLEGLKARAAAKPADPWPRYFLASVLSNMGRGEEAILETERLAKAPKKHQWMRHKHGELLLTNRRDHEGAEREYKAALASVPGFWKARAALAEIALCRGDEKAAAARADELVASMPERKRPAALAVRGRLRLWAGDAAGALSDLDAAVGAGIPQTLRPRGAALLLSGRLDEAAADLDEALRSGPDAEALTWRGELRRRRGDFAGAIEDLGAAIRQDGSNSFWALANRALARSASGDAAGAWSDYATIRRDVLDFFEKRAGKAPADSADQEALRAVLEAGLALGRGVRASNEHLFPVWMGHGRGA
ncbi:MAG: tetratricopeptide repeat protein [Elusimicrobiota bacterium]|nr:MAG: tetratricopeptide repeat protein [Elusimicrobiota bacterium]